MGTAIAFGLRNGVYHVQRHRRYQMLGIPLEASGLSFLVAGARQTTQSCCSLGMKVLAEPKVPQTKLQRSPYLQ